MRSCRDTYNSASSFSAGAWTCFCTIQDLATDSNNLNKDNKWETTFLITTDKRQIIRTSYIVTDCLIKSTLPPCDKCFTLNCSLKTFVDCTICGVKESIPCDSL